MSKHDVSRNHSSALDSIRCLIGRCGLYCGACDIYRVFMDKKKDRQKRMAEFFKCRPEQVRCQGCQNPTSEDWCSDCKIVRCLSKPGYHYCYECESIENCDIYQGLNGRYKNIPFKNLSRLKEIGEKRWLEEQMKRWHCPGCGEPIEYSADSCAECGRDLTTIKE